MILRDGDFEKTDLERRLTANYNGLSWSDTFVADFEKGKQFYSELFDWNFTDQLYADSVVYSLASLAHPEYSSAQLTVAGLGPCEIPKPGGIAWNWGAYILVENVDAMLEHVVAAGGQLCKEPMDVMGAGRMAVCADSCGAVIHLWQAREHFGADADDVPGAVCWFELTSPDTQRSASFYTEVFGWTPKETVSNDRKYWEFYAGDKLLSTMHARLEETAQQGLWLPYFKTENLESQLAACKSLGGSVVYGPVLEPGVGRYAILADFESNMFGIAEFDRDR